MTGYGWSPLLVATQNRNYKLGAFLLEKGADPNLANKGGWSPLYLATDNRNIENGDYPVRKPDMDHLDFIKLLLDKGADVNARVKDSTEIPDGVHQPVADEDGATAFLRASQSGDLVLMKLLLARGADPKINTMLNVTPLQVAAGIGWVEGVTYEWSEQATLETVQTAARPGDRSELSGQHRPRRRCTAPRTRDARRSFRCWWTTAPSSTSAITATPTTAAASSPFTPGSRSTTPTASFGSACSRRLRTPKTGLLLRKLLTASGSARAAGGPDARIHLYYRSVRVTLRG